MADQKAAFTIDWPFTHGSQNHPRIGRSVGMTGSPIGFNRRILVRGTKVEPVDMSAYCGKLILHTGVESAHLHLTVFASRCAVICRDEHQVSSLVKFKDRLAASP